MAQIRHSYKDYYGRYTEISGIEFLNKEGKSLLSFGEFDGDFEDLFEVADYEQVIGIKAHTHNDPTDW